MCHNEFSAQRIGCIQRKLYTIHAAWNKLKRGADIQTSQGFLKGNLFHVVHSWSQSKVDFGVYDNQWSNHWEDIIALVKV